jgi:hypothetical protein
MKITCKTMNKTAIKINKKLMAQKMLKTNIFNKSSSQFKPSYVVFLRGAIYRVNRKKFLMFLIYRDFDYAVLHN